MSNLDLNWIIQSKNLKKKYKKASFYSVDDLNISIEKGMIYGILGPNGAGKTTTLSMLCGFLKPTSGEIFFPSLSKKSDIKKIIGFVPQELAIYPKLTAKENLQFFGNLYGINKNILKEKIEELLVLVGLEKRSDEQIENFSTGMKRRINFAVGLIHDPKIILLDEPTVGIDPQSRNCIFDAIFKLKKDGITILYTTHYMEEASRLCDIVAIMDNGKIIIEGNPIDLVGKHSNHKLIFVCDTIPDNRFSDELKDIKGIKNTVIQNSFLTVSVLNTADNITIIEEIIRRSSIKKINLSLIKIEEPNLENLFLDLTGRTLRDDCEN